MKKDLIFLAVEDLDIGKRFYRDVMGFYLEGPYFYLPNTPSRSCLSLTLMTAAERKKYGKTGGCTQYPSFQYPIGSDFRSYCRERRERGARFTFVTSYDGAHVAEMVDPFDNIFHVICEDPQDSAYKPPSDRVSLWSLRDFIEDYEDSPATPSSQPSGGR